MSDDPIVSEVRKAREQIEQECGRSFEKIYALAIEVQKELGDRLAGRRVIELPAAFLSTKDRLAA